MHHRRIEVDGHSVFYREAGDPACPTLLLLHGFPTSSHMFRDLIPLLADSHHVVAPDLPGFGFTQSPAGYRHSFDSLAEVIGGFIDALGLKRRDGEAERMMLVVADTRHNRAVLRAAAVDFAAAFPADIRDALKALREGRDPASDVLLMV